MNYWLILAIGLSLGFLYFIKSGEQDESQQVENQQVENQQVENQQVVKSTSWFCFLFFLNFFI